LSTINTISTLKTSLVSLAVFVAVISASRATSVVFLRRNFSLLPGKVVFQLLIRHLLLLRRGLLLVLVLMLLWRRYCLSLGLLTLRRGVSRSLNVRFV